MIERIEHSHRSSSASRRSAPAGVRCVVAVHGGRREPQPPRLSEPRRIERSRRPSGRLWLQQLRSVRRDDPRGSSTTDPGALRSFDERARGGLRRAGSRTPLRAAASPRWSVEGPSSCKGWRENQLCLKPTGAIARTARSRRRCGALSRTLLESRSEGTTIHQPAHVAACRRRQGRAGRAAGRGVGRGAAPSPRICCPLLPRRSPLVPPVGRPAR
jgi:hypothetical protein